MDSSRYSFELWARNGTMLADLTGRAKNRRIVQSRNEPEEIFWQLNMNEFEQHARAIGVPPSTLLIPGSTEIRVRRGTEYICGGQLVWRQPHISAGEQDIQLRARGFLDLLAKRYTPERVFYEQMDGPEMAVAMINYTQGRGDYWDFGITIGSIESLNDPHDKTFKANEIKEAIQRTTLLYDYDIEFTHDKVFNAYKRLGSERPDVIFDYPGNIIDITSPLDATNLKNYITVNGSGSGEEANNRVPVEDASSQANYYVREDIINYSEVEDEEDLTNHGEIALAEWSMPFEIPTLTVSGNKRPFVTDYKVGDMVRVKCKRYELLEGINGMYRVEKRTIEIDDNDRETVTLELGL
jgi:hypothetical protein